MTRATSTSPYVIRAATADDLAPIVALLEAFALPTAGVAEALPGFLVAESGGAIVGSVGVETTDSEYALLRSTAVHEAWRGRGVGRELIDRAIAAANANGIVALYLLTTTAESYFPGFGFVRVARDEVPHAIGATEEFLSACPASATVMMLRLARRERHA